MAGYPGRYQDALGEEQIVFENDFETLRVEIRGVTYAGYSFESLKPLFTDLRASGGGEPLCDCALECDMPLSIVSGVGVEDGLLRIWLKLDPPRETYSLGEPGFTLRLCLTVAGQEYCSAAAPVTLETAFNEIERALPDGVTFMSCFTCAFSDYSPYGHGILGHLACFRDNRAAYLQVRDKDDLFAIWDTHTEMVQDTYLCPEYKRRKPGTGYRG